MNIFIVSRHFFSRTQHGRMCDKLWVFHFAAFPFAASYVRAISPRFPDRRRFTLPNRRSEMSRSSKDVFGALSDAPRRVLFLRRFRFSVDNFSNCAEGMLRMSVKGYSGGTSREALFEISFTLRVFYPEKPPKKIRNREFYGGNVDVFKFLVTFSGRALLNTTEKFGFWLWNLFYLKHFSMFLLFSQLCAENGVKSGYNVPCRYQNCVH